MILNILSFACPFLLASTGALFTQFSGMLALYLDGLITLGGFTTYLFTFLTKSSFIGVILSLTFCILFIFILTLIIKKTNADVFISGLGINLLCNGLTSLLSFLCFKSRGVLYSKDFVFSVKNIQIIEIVITSILIISTIFFIKKTQKGIYFRICGSDSNVLNVKGVNSNLYKTLSWIICTFFAVISGSFLSFRISSFVPNLSGGKGWICLASVLLGNKKIWKTYTFVLIFSIIDFMSAKFQSLFTQIPTSFFLSLPYLVALIFIILPSKDK